MDKTIRQPVPQPGQTHGQYHELHQMYGFHWDGRCWICFPLLFKKEKASARH